jgi:histone H3/H4
MSDWIVVKAKIKEIAGKVNIGGDYADALNAKVKAMVQDSIKRAEANGRRTVFARDL